MFRSEGSRFLQQLLGREAKSKPKTPPNELGSEALGRMTGASSEKDKETPSEPTPPMTIEESSDESGVIEFDYADPVDTTDEGSADDIAVTKSAPAHETFGIEPGPEVTRSEPPKSEAPADTGATWPRYQSKVDADVLKSPAVDTSVEFEEEMAEAFDQVWVRVQRQLGRPQQDDDVDEESVDIRHRSIQSVIVTSWNDEEGASTISLGLAGRAGASMPGQVCLVDADFHGKSLTKASRTENRPGLGELLSHDANLQDVIIRHEKSPFAFIPSGAIPNKDLLSNDARLQQVISTLEMKYRYVFYDCSSLKRGIESYRWGRLVVNALLVVKAGTNRRQTITHAVTQLQLHGMELVGTVLNQRVDTIPDWLYPFV